MFKELEVDVEFLRWLCMKPSSRNAAQRSFNKVQVHTVHRKRFGTFGTREERKQCECQMSCALGAHKTGAQTGLTSTIDVQSLTESYLSL